jgi:hypothetical protein
LVSLFKMLHDLVIAVDLLVPAFIDDALVKDAAGHAFQSSFGSTTATGLM